MDPIQSVLVLGGGSAGLLAAITLKRKLPTLDVTVLYSPEIGVIGVGEGTTNYVPEHLHGYLGVPMGEFFAEAQPSWKLGVRFLWGPRREFYYPFALTADRREPGLARSVGYYVAADSSYTDRTSALMAQGRAFVRLDNGAPLIERNVAYHLENEMLVRYLERLADVCGVRRRMGTVEHVAQDGHGVRELKLTTGETVTADLFVDCSGFRSELLGAALEEPFIDFRKSLLCDRAVLGGWDRTDEPILPFTTAETMSGGWCWQIEHEHRINRGYVYSSDFTTDAAAEAEFRAAHPRLTKTRLVKFTTGYYRRCWVKNVVAIGNAAGFVEPLEATAIFVICAVSQALAESLAESKQRPEDAMRQQVNEYSRRIWESIRNFLAVHYRFNSRLETPFWQACRADVDLAGARPIVDYYQAYGPSGLWRHTLIDPIDPFRLDGYYCLLLGQQVPFAQKYEPSPEEYARWQALQGEWKLIAERGFSIAEALEIVRSPAWQWNPGFYARQ
jgi:tryptophan halogenase